MIDTTNGRLVIIEDGKSDYTIVICKDASPSEQYAALELRQHLEEMTGVRLPIVTDCESPRDKEIVLGWHTRAKENKIDFDAEKIGSSGFVIEFLDGNIYILGNEERGTLYGVYSLLEDDLGCRWYAPDVTVIPKTKRVVLDMKSRIERPPFEIRNVPYHEFIEHPEWAARNRLTNTWSGKMNAKYGGASPWAGKYCHTFERLVPPEEFFDTHPEYFAMVNAERDPKAQLCLSNPDVLAIVTTRVLDLLQKSPGKTLVSVSQNDGDRGYCECPHCKALDEREGSPSASIITFVNKVAESVEQHYPEVMVHTFAYTYGRKAPRSIKPRANVLVELCTIECSFTRPLNAETYENNRLLCKDMDGWKKLGAKLAVWDYVVNFHHYFMPFPNYDILAHNVRYFAECGVISLNEQANYESSGGELSLLRGWVLAKLLWNPHRDPKSLLGEFIDAYYQESAPPVFGYLDFLSRIAQNQTVCGIFGHPPDLFDVDSAKEADRFWEQAEALARNPEIRRRVELSRLSTRYLRLALSCPSPTVSLPAPGEDRAQGVVSHDEEVNNQLFFEVAEREGVSRYTERDRGTIEDLMIVVGR